MSTPGLQPDFEATPNGETIRLTAVDGHELEAYLSRPAGRPRGGLVVAQEMYGLTRYLTAVCDLFAAHGYLTIAPALYDRQQRGLVFAYTDADHDRAQVLFNGWPWDKALDDLDAAKAAVAHAGKVAMVGYCWGGSLAWLAACRREYACTIAYYGSAMPKYADETARCPVLANCGDKDASMPLDGILMFRERQPGVVVSIFAGARHAFDNPLRGDNRFHQEASDQSRRDTLALLARHVG